MPRSAPRLAAAALLAGAASLAATPARAQTPAGPAFEKPLGPGTRDGEPRWQGGLGFGVTQPVHEFRRSVPNRGIGGVVHALYRLGGSGAFALRADGNFLRYGSERRTVPIIPGVGRVTADLVTTNSIGGFTVGPQLMVPTGPVRPYALAGLGAAGFSTTSTLEDRDNTYDDDRVIARDQNLSDWTLARAGGGGVLVRLGRGRRSIGFLDVGARYQHNGRARYLTKGGIRDNANGTVTLDVREGQANFWTYHVGFALGTR